MRVPVLFLVLSPLVVAGGKPNRNLANLDYRVYPLRTDEEAAVLEWGHSAIISALDLSVARFGPQTSEAALLEVECKPVLASPLDGIGTRGIDPETNELIVQALDNADEVHGNLVVMTNSGDLTGVQMARVAKLSGAVAVLVVNVLDKRPDDIYRLALEEGETADDIDIPVAMVSLNSANVLTSATVTPQMQASEVVNNGMPERVRLYAGGDRPFFEDVEPSNPTLYLIHNLLTEEEVKNMIQSVEGKLSPVTTKDLLQLQPSPENFPGVSRVMLWQGMLQSPGQKAVDERIEQVTGFPASYYSDWVVDKLEPGAHWLPHYDDPLIATAMATITVFLTADGGPVVYPSSKPPVKVLPRRGMAIVHHNTDDKLRQVSSSVHAMLPQAEGAEPAYVARKYVFKEPVSNSRRIALPIFALPFGGKLPSVIVDAHNILIEKFGPEQGPVYFDKACVFLPLLIILIIVQYVVDHLQRQLTGGGSSDKKKSEQSASKKSKKD